MSKKKKQEEYQAIKDTEKLLKKIGIASNTYATEIEDYQLDINFTGTTEDIVGQYEVKTIRFQDKYFQGITASTISDRIMYLKTPKEYYANKRHWMLNAETLYRQYKGSKLEKVRANKNNGIAFVCQDYIYLFTPQDTIKAEDGLIMYNVQHTTDFSNNTKGWETKMLYDFKYAHKYNRYTLEEVPQ